LRKARKEAYKSSSTVIKLQEELKSARNSLRITQSGFELEKQKVQRKEQDTFNAQYQLAALEEEVDKLRANLQIVEEERNALKSRLREEEIAQIAADGLIALPISREDDADLRNSPAKCSPRKQHPSPLSDDKENVGVTPKRSLETRRLREELMREQMRREHAEEMMEFLSLECKFRCCSCQNASKVEGGLGLSLNVETAAALDHLTTSMKKALALPSDFEDANFTQVGAREIADEATRDDCDIDVAGRLDPAAEQTVLGQENGDEIVAAEVDAACWTVPQPALTGSQASCVARATSIENACVNDVEAVGPTTTHKASLVSEHSPPRTPVDIDNVQPTTSRLHQPSIRTITTTTTIPTHFTPVAKPVPPPIDYPEGIENVPPPPAITSDSIPFDRAAALAAIEYRRGRAKSFAAGHMTPRKQMLEGSGLMKERRDISAPALGGKTTAGVGGSAKAPGSVGRAAGRRLI